jgi:putative membrane protein (TIGR04086 family)
MNGKSIGDMAPRLGGTPVLQGLIYAFTVAVSALILASLLVTWTSVSESALPTITYIVNLAATLTGAFVAARRSRERGWYYGGLTGLLYSLLITILGFMILSASFSFASLVQIAILSIIGGLGGVIGVNTARSR